MSNGLTVDRFQEGLQTKWLGRNIFFVHSVASTNVWASELAKLGATEGTVAIADTQTAGRGRLSRRWFSPEGGLWFSIILKPELDAGKAPLLVFVSGLAVAETLCDLYKLSVETKWPNDVLVKGKKICGILSEMKTRGKRVESVVIGIGLNVNFSVKKALREELWCNVTSVEDELGRKAKLGKLFQSLLENFEAIYQSSMLNGFASIIMEWKKYAGFLGKNVEVAVGSEKVNGLACDVDDNGALILRLADGTVSYADLPKSGLKDDLFSLILDGRLWRF